MSTIEGLRKLNEQGRFNYKGLRPLPSRRRNKELKALEASYKKARSPLMLILTSDGKTRIVLPKHFTVASYFTAESELFYSLQVVKSALLPHRAMLTSEQAKRAEDFMKQLDQLPHLSGHMKLLNASASLLRALYDELPSSVSLSFEPLAYLRSVLDAALYEDHLSPELYSEAIDVLRYLIGFVVKNLTYREHALELLSSIETDLILEMSLNFSEESESKFVRRSPLSSQ